MAGRKFYQAANPAHPFNYPEIVGRDFRPGRQVYNPGEAQLSIDYGVTSNPWPRMVGSLLYLTKTNPGIPHGPAPDIENNRPSTLLQNFLFLGNVAKKSKG